MSKNTFQMTLEAPQNPSLVDFLCVDPRKEFFDPVSPPRRLLVVAVSQGKCKKGDTAREKIRARRVEVEVVRGG